MQTQTYELADISDRVIALIIDSVIVGILGSIIGVGGGAALFGGSLASFVLGVGYQWYFLTQQNGQTLGKMVMDLRVIKTNGTEISDADAALRYVGYLLNSAVLMIGWLWAGLDDNNQGWHDKIAGTYVVKASSNNDDILDKSKRKNEDYV